VGLSAYAKGMAAGVALAIGCIVACGDSVTSIDAAPRMPDATPAMVCDCPPAEKPLAGRIRQFQQQSVWGAEGGGVGFDCGEGVLLGGKCEVERTSLGTTGPQDFVPRLNGVGNEPGVPFPSQSYTCQVTPSDSDDSRGTIAVTIICLMPN
jgi:hypothetical protein